MFLGKIASPSCTNSEIHQNVLLTRYSLPVLALVVALLVISTMRPSTDKSSIAITTGQIKAWMTTAFFLSCSVVFIEGLSQIGKIQLAISLYLYLFITVIYFSLLVHIASLKRFLLFSSALVLPGIINAARGCVSSISPAHEVMIQSAIIASCSAVMLGWYLLSSGSIRFEQTKLPKFYQVVLSVLAVTLFFGAITVPARMSSNDKRDYLHIVAASRLSIFAVTTFLLCASSLIISAPQHSFSKVINQRRTGVIASLISLTSLVFVFVYLPLSGINRALIDLAIIVTLVSTMFSVLLPWILFRLRDNRLDKFDVIAICVASTLILMFRRDASEWQLIAFGVLLILVLLSATRHVFRFRQMLGIKELDTNHRSTNLDGHLVSVVIPSFNPGPEIIRTVQRVKSEFDRASRACEIIVVSDGSTDESPQMIDQCEEVDQHIWLRTNHGKGAALREGFARSSGFVICFIDADGDLDPSVLPSMVLLIDEAEYDIVYGSKLHPLSNVEMTRLRKLISSGFRFFVKLLFRFDVSDTQTGIKAFSGELIAETLPLVSENGFNIDLELFVVAHALGYTRFGEHPIVLHRKGDSTVGLSAVFQMLISTLRLFRRRTLTLDYVPLGKES